MIVGEKLKMWKAHGSWDEAEKKWDSGVEKAAKKRPLKKLRSLPKMLGITPDTARHLKWKSFKWMLLQDHEKKIWHGFFTHPFKYGWAYLKSVFRKKSWQKKGDFFLYGVKTVEEFETLIENPNSVLVVGFSYCHKPFECPSGRFSSKCIHDPDHPVCRQCFIGKAMNALPENQVIPLIIPTVHYIGGKMFEIVEKHPNKIILFLITACEMTLEMFGDWGNMLGIKGIGVRLNGRICNTMEAFVLSENGVKPGLTVVQEDTQKKLMEMIRHRRDHTS